MPGFPMCHTRSSDDNGETKEKKIAGIHVGTFYFDLAMSILLRLTFLLGLRPRLAFLSAACELQSTAED